MPTAPARRTARTTVAINGFALREVRLRSGVEIADLARQIDVSRAYLTKVEIGRSLRVSAKVYTALLAALAIRDRRALLAQPHIETGRAA